MNKPNVIMLFVAKLLFVCWLAQPVLAQPADVDLQLSQRYQQRIVPLLKQYCADCHGHDLAEAEVNLLEFASMQSVRQGVSVWEKVSEMFSSHQMPPINEPQLTEAERQEMVGFLHTLLSQEALRTAGDPGPIVLRRLSNAEYTYSVRALTGVDALDPAREFPIDGASGEGFTNAGNGLVMSPALLTKYLDAGKSIAEHAVLLPDGLRFSASTSRRDWTEEILAEIRSLYAKYSANEGASQVNLQGIVFDTNAGGRLPVGDYLQALGEAQAELRSGSMTIEQLAQQRNLSVKYLHLLWNALNQPSTQLMQQLAKQWQAGAVDNLAGMVAWVHNWQKALWKFNSVGHIGKLNGPTSWMQAVDPVSTQQDFRVPISKAANGAHEISLYLAVGDAGDGSEGDEVVWESPRLVAPGRADLLLKDVDRIGNALQQANTQYLSSAGAALSAADALMKHPELTLEQLASQSGCSSEILLGWFEYLGIRPGHQFQITGHLSKTISSASGYDFVCGWVGDDALSVLTNSSDQHVRVPGNMFPHSVAVHPAPAVQMVIGWQCPVASTVHISGHLRHAHPECGNGVVWTLQLRRGATVQTLANGTAQGDQSRPIEVPEPVAVTPTDVICLVVGPRDGNHSCDLTNVQLVLEQVADERANAERKKWDLAADISGDPLAGNPHTDSYGNSSVWHFFGEPVGGPTGPVIPTGSVLAQWQATGDSAERERLAQQLLVVLKAQTVEELAQLPPPDQILRTQLRSLSGPLMASTLQRLSSQSVADASQSRNADITFGRRVDGSAGDANHLYSSSSTVTRIVLPASLAEGCEIVTTARLANEEGPGSVQLSISTQPIEPTGLVASATREQANSGVWTSSGTQVSSIQPVIVSSRGSAQSKFETAFAQFRELFPASLCYSKIVPVDEVVTLTLYYREDEPLQRLMLTDKEIADLDRLWNELHFVSRDPLALVDAYEQLWQYATQDADPSAFEPLRAPIMNRAAQFRQELLDARPGQIQAVKALASRAFRRPLATAEQQEIDALYDKLCAAEVPHEHAVAALISRLFVSPAFLYRLETGQGPVRSINDGQIAVRELSDYELATRLSYFLTSSLPDHRLRQLADKGQLRQPDVLAAEVQRLLKDSQARQLATEFGCQWLHVYDFATHDEKSEQTFPTFVSLRESMYEEAIRFWSDLLVNDRSVLELLNSDYLFINRALAEHYAIQWPSDSTENMVKLDDEWIRLAGAGRLGRGGIMTLSAVLSKQSGASRTSPILRGNWISEAMLGEKPPKPPAGVPPLPETPPAGLTERQITEMHSSRPDCARCHIKIDPLGYALEGFDAIGRRRDPALYNTASTLEDGTQVTGMEQLRDYIAGPRRADFLRQFCKKLLGFSLGRAVQLSDQPLIDEMLATLSENDYRIQPLIVKIVASPQFQSVRVDH